MKCEECGSELSKFTEFCVCGSKNPSYNNPTVESIEKEKRTYVYTNSSSSSYSSDDEKCGFAIAALIFGLLGGWLGLVFGIVGLTKYKKTSSKVMCIIGIVAWGLWMVYLITHPGAFFPQKN